MKYASVIAAVALSFLAAKAEAQGVVIGGGNSVPVGNNVAGSVAAVVATLPAVANKTNYLCGFNVQAIGGTASSGPIVVAGLLGGSQTYQTDVNSATVGKELAKGNFTLCLPASAPNTAITITTTANGTATAVDVNSWGFLQ